MNKTKKNITIKDFDAVKMMREIREILSKKYWKNPNVLKKDMETIRKKYAFKKTVKTT